MVSSNTLTDNDEGEPGPTETVRSGVNVFHLRNTKVEVRESKREL